MAGLSVIRAVLAATAAKIIFLIRLSFSTEWSHYRRDCLNKS
jgi:hypothetical protein